MFISQIISIIILWPFKYLFWEINNLSKKKKSFELSQQRQRRHKGQKGGTVRPLCLDTTMTNVFYSVWKIFPGVYFCMIIGGMLSPDLIVCFLSDKRHQQEIHVSPSDSFNKCLCNFHEAGVNMTLSSLVSLFILFLRKQPNHNIVRERKKRGKKIEGNS